MAIDSEILEAAAAWHVRLEGELPDFEGFSEWLEADARHREAYDKVIALDAVVDEHVAELAVLMPANDVAAESYNHRLRWTGIAGAIAIVLGAGTYALRETGSANIEIATQKGEMQSIRLADASQISLDGNSTISYAKNDQRALALLHGSAHFAIEHDAARPFSINVGGYQIRDLGTAFSVSHMGGHLSISVSSGLVEVRAPGMTRVAIRPGERFDFENGKFEKSRIDPASVGSWRQGRLAYNNAPLRLVVADLNRYAPHHVELDPALSGRRFSGVLTIGDGTQLASTLASVMAISIKSDSSGVWLGDSNSR